MQSLRSRTTQQENVGTLPPMGQIPPKTASLLALNALPMYLLLSLKASI